MISCTYNSSYRSSLAAAWNVIPGASDLKRGGGGGEVNINHSNLNIDLARPK